MGSSDRDYNRGWGGEDYLGNPASILGLSVPFGTWFGVRVTLNFWMILELVLIVFGIFSRIPPLVVALECVFLVGSALLHDFGHKWTAEAVGARHDEFVLWPAGGMQFPRNVPPGAWPMFVAHVGGMLVNLIICIGCLATLFLLRGVMPLPSLNPMDWLTDPFQLAYGGGWSSVVVSLLWSANISMLLINFLPYYWFDGGYLLQSILWPFLGVYQSINITCFVGMLIAVPMFFLSLADRNLWGLVFWVWLFSAAFLKRRELVASGPAGLLEADISYSAQDINPRVRKWKQPNWANAMARRAAQAKRDQAKIDAILQKVSEKGMNSLSWWEKRTLRKATERQRRQHAG